MTEGLIIKKYFDIDSKEYVLSYRDKVRILITVLAIVLNR